MIIILMGVSGAGKTTVGRLLAASLNCSFYDADDSHPPDNVAKMQQGIPLTDADRQPWLAALESLIRKSLHHKEDAVLACSALKADYRRRLRVADAVRFVYLRGSYDLIRARLESRHGHYMPPDLLASQFAALEEPADALVTEIDGDPEEIAARIRRALT